MTLAADLPTLRLTTLRTLTRHAAPIAVVHLSTPLADLAAHLVDHRTWVVAVDDAGVLRGVLSCVDALRALRTDPEGWLADHLARQGADATPRTSITLDAEAEIAEAAAAVAAAGADHVLVVSARGHLLGVVEANVVGAYRRAA